ncbi:MAG: carboxypeptidase-like regulatory domain-containing protein, partial [Gemmatimonadota bacterium]
MPAQASAQQTGSIGGIVVDAQTMQPLSGVQVFIAGTSIGTITTAEGRFLLNNVAGDRVQVRVTMIGYAEASLMASPGDMNLRFA